MKTSSLKKSVEEKQANFSPLLTGSKKSITALQKKNNIIREEPVQNFLPFHSIHNGVIRLIDDQYISYLEVYPLNFFEKSIARQNIIIRNYKTLFINELIRAKFITLCDKSNPEALLMNIYTQCKNQKDPVIAKRLEDYAQFVRGLSQSGTVSRRFFIIFEYQGDDNGVKSHNRAEIEETMFYTRQRLIHIMMNCGNACHTPSNYDGFLYEFLYMFFNRNSYLKEPLNVRLERLNRDFKRYNELHPEEKRYITLNDIIGSKGLYFVNKSYAYQDGLFYTYLVLKKDSWPSSVSAAWTNNFIMDYQANLDLTIITEEVNEKIASIGVNQIYADRRQRSHAAINNRKSGDKIEKVSSSFSDIAKVKAHLDGGDDIFNCSLMLTIRGNSPKEVLNIRREIIKSLAKKGVKMDDSFMTVKHYYMLSLPIINTSNRVFRENAHNVTTTTMGDFYNYTAREVKDNTGAVIGQADNLSLLAVDNFNTTKYANANMAIFGTSGAGKTFFEQILGTRKLLMGERVFYIIPKKGYEYKGSAEMCNGVYIKLGPGSNDCINILEIRPEGEIDLSQVGDDVVFQEMSWMQKKIGVVTVWLQSLMKGTVFTDAQYSKISMHLTNLYNRFDIDENNSSIFNIETGELKEMPILSDLVEEFKADSLVSDIAETVDSFIKGSGKAMNQQTNVNLDNNFIVYDVDEDAIGERYLASYLYIAFQNVYDVTKSNVSIRDNIFLDEVWKLMADEQCAKQVQNMIKLVRGYMACTIIATQEMQDFFGKTGDFGLSVLNNSRLIVLLCMLEKDADLVKDTLKLTAEDIEKITSYQRGEGMLIANHDKIHMYIAPSDREKRYFEKYTSSGKDVLIHGRS